MKLIYKPFGIIFGIVAGLLDAVGDVAAELVVPPSAAHDEQPESGQDQPSSDPSVLYRASAIPEPSLPKSESAPLRPLVCGDRHGHCVYLRSLTKCTAPGLRMETIAGHSRTMQCVRLEREGRTLFGFADLVPELHAAQVLLGDQVDHAGDGVYVTFGSARARSRCDAFGSGPMQASTTCTPCGASARPITFAASACVRP